ncbi:hypothetical protein GQ600_25678 [Phytophthora cactorum]|nr:hypothetical protein GQ600_25678 [Phytophthora cactorum]
METMDEGMVKCIIVIRNVLRWMQTDSSAQERLKNLLHELKQEDGTTDIKCGVVIQTRVQSLPLSNEERTTRLTSRTERTTRVSSTEFRGSWTTCGISVLDFLALNEQAVSMSAILEFFKEKNLRTWRKVQTFVIDKHFVEWQVLGSCFPQQGITLSISCAGVQEEDPGYNVWSEAG